MSYRVGTKEWPTYSIKIRVPFEVHHTLWDRIKLKKPILVKIRQQKVYLDEVWTKKVWGKFKNGSYFDTIGGHSFVPTLYTRFKTYSLCG